MKRVIKFRGYNKKNQKWIYGYYFVNRGKHFIVEDGIANPQNTWEDYVVDGKTIGQFTGIYGNEGKEIYEGDIVECWSQGNKARGEVKCRKDGLWYMYPAWQEKKMWRICPDDEGYDDVNVIGNFHEHPELLKSI